MANFYKSRLKRGNYHIDPMPNDIAGTSMRNGVVIGDNLYFITRNNETTTGYYNNFRVYKWNGRTSSPQLVNNIDIQNNSYDEFYGGNRDGLECLNYNDELFLTCRGASAASANTIHRILNIKNNQINLIADFPPYFDSEWDGSNARMYYEVKAIRMVVFDGKIHAVSIPDLSAVDYYYQDVGSAKNNWIYNSRHYAFYHNSDFSNVYWIKKSTPKISSMSIMFSDIIFPIVWKNALYVFATDYYNYSDVNDTKSSTTGTVILSYDGTSWSPFYRKILSSGVPVDDSQAYGVSTSQHKIYVKELDGSYSTLASNPGGATVLNDELYLYDSNGMMKYDETLGQFVRLPGDSSGNGDLTIVGFNNKIYSVASGVRYFDFN